MAIRARAKTSERLPELMKALAEPRRIAIVRLVHEQELPAGEIAKHFRTTRQAISQHLRLMTDAGVLDMRREGTKRLYRVRKEAFGELRTFLEIFWEDSLSRLKRAVEAGKDPHGGRWGWRTIGMADDRDDKPVIKEIFIDARPEEVFPHLVESEKYLLWMGVSAQLDARPGGVFEVDPNGRDVILGEFLEVDPPRRVVFTWGWKQPGHAVPAGSTRVEIELRPQGAGTLLRLTHRGLAGPSREQHEFGWGHYLARLKTIVSGGDPGPDPFADPNHRHG